MYRPIPVPPPFAPSTNQWLIPPPAPPATPVASHQIAGWKPSALLARFMEIFDLKNEKDLQHWCKIMAERQ